MTSLHISWLDFLILLPLLYGLIRGAMRGLISELVGIAAVVLGVIGVRILGADTSSWLIAQFSWPDMVCQIVSTVGIFILIALVLTLLGSLLTKLFKAIHLGWVNRLTGALIGTLKWSIVVIIFVLVLNFLDGQFALLSPEMKDSSPIYTLVLDCGNQIWNHIYPSVNPN